MAKLLGCRLIYCSIGSVSSLCNFHSVVEKIFFFFEKLSSVFLMLPLVIEKLPQTLIITENPPDKDGGFCVSAFCEGMLAENKSIVERAEIECCGSRFDVEKMY